MTDRDDAIRIAKEAISNPNTIRSRRILAQSFLIEVHRNNAYLLQCLHPGCGCVCGHTKQCPYGGQSPRRLPVDCENFGGEKMNREYNLGTIGTDDFYKNTVQMHRDTLVSCRGKSEFPEELEWEIRLYDYILEDPSVRYPAYQKARYDNDNRQMLSKRDVVKKLGWVVS
jgi:hypothetical protein